MSNSVIVDQERHAVQELNRYWPNDTVVQTQALMIRANTIVKTFNTQGKDIRNYVLLEEMVFENKFSEGLAMRLVWRLRG